ncbi:MAG: hypothetical protein Q9184_006706 [Pyrenodesmia sp. 2 TL-2023]
MSHPGNLQHPTDASRNPPPQFHLGRNYPMSTFLKDFDALLSQRWAFIMHQILYGEGLFKRLYYQQLLQMKVVEDKTEAWRRRRIAETDERRWGR